MRSTTCIDRPCPRAMDVASIPRPRCAANVDAGRMDPAMRPERLSQSLWADGLVGLVGAD